VKTGHNNWRRRREFLDFMCGIVVNHPDREIHVILDNLNTHKPKDDRWLKRQPNVRLHFIPTYASWLNQVEVLFNILDRRFAEPSSTSPAQLRQAIDEFVGVYNQKAAQFEWRRPSCSQLRRLGTLIYASMYQHHRELVRLKYTGRLRRLTRCNVYAPAAWPFLLRASGLPAASGLSPGNFINNRTWLNGIPNVFEIRSSVSPRRIIRSTWLRWV
jgi:transposase